MMIIVYWYLFSNHYTVFVRRQLRHRTLCRILALLRRRRRTVGWADVLLDAIGVGWKAPSALWDGCLGTMTGVSQHWFFNANALPCITIGADVWGESGIMTGVY